ncbi:aspartyl protease family protein [Akkermansiaceae bacterium]|nr:aspartyl protease family protein [bacterium]MDB4301682.1 aspartyl protease family protein [Akkermansiaceae bacterium]MDB4418796.1 aspartyl protease family protein [bacterium]MDB4670105.1 aspartyl protease family protein [Akkermansiaceae bacterium]MDB4688545.1 aspartyl protease family protein [Akkermansiaceae bacterium]
MGTRVFRGVSALLAAFLLSQCASVPTSFGNKRAKTLKKMGYVSVPLQKVTDDVRYSGLFEVNGKPLRFLIDSGANSTDVESKIASQVGLRPDNSIKVITRGALGREIKSGHGRGSLRVGPMHADNFPFTIAPSSSRETSTSRYAGQVGLDALDATGALVDIPAGKIWLPGRFSKRASTDDPSPLGYRESLGHRVLYMGRAGRLPHLLLHGTLNGRHTSWVVDTGAEISVMAAASFNRLNLPSQTTNSRMVDASGDKIALRRGQLKNLRFGEVNISSFDIAIAPLPEVRQYFRDPTGRPVDGILGMDFLTNGRALLDSGSRILYMGKP